MKINWSYIQQSAVFFLLLATGGIAWSQCNTDGGQTGATSVILLQGNGDFTCSQAAGDGGQTMREAIGFSYVEGTDSISWSASEQVDKIYVQEKGNGSRCLYDFEPGQTAGDSLMPTNTKNVVGCSDGVDDVVGSPVLRIDKKVVRVILEGTPPIEVYDCAIDPVDPLDVVAPTKVVYCYTVTNYGQGPAEGVVINDDNAGGIAFTVPVGVLDAGATTVVDSGHVLIENSGKLVNTATVEGYYQGSICDTCTDTDTATVNAVVACNDTSAQTAANNTGTVIESTTIDGISVCGPQESDPDGDNLVSLASLCDGRCDIRDECKANPADCVQPCEPSGNWTYLTSNLSGGSCMAASPSAGKLPLCHEVLGNPSNTHDSTCSNTKKPSFIRSNGNKTTWSSNPTIICVGCDADGGGDSTGTIYCLTNGTLQDKALCPPNSFIY